MIQNLLFDLGGVIMDIKKDNCVQALRELGFRNPDEYLGDYSQKGPFGQFEQGLITPDEFRGFVRSQIDGPVTDMQIDDAFNEFLIGIPVERLRLLQQLRHTYGIYLLSNTNAIMWNARIAEEFRKDGLDIDAYFDGIVTSFEAKLLKPDVKIFDYAAAHCDIKPEETLFLDDSLANLGAAERAGFRTAHVPEGVEYSKVLADLNLL
ncbi:MAG: HAD family phosphatase [Muribaculaceae bacterium]|nr:HAD family phosphatase [Muribaculaceae bacterium]